jgi:hypothetical protein
MVSSYQFLMRLEPHGVFRRISFGGVYNWPVEMTVSDYSCGLVFTFWFFDLELTTWCDSDSESEGLQTSSVACMLVVLHLHVNSFRWLSVGFSLRNINRFYKFHLPPPKHS